ncbi:UPF0415 protein C7orf25 homolog [Rhagoletis pomonella]|uniref:UPF0415 protein C7orf25 homolog n=1 Tax=Rhagoletis pomonella TaxID=28610 RepID=UPI001783B246|nr:UPF0415 protein C7orf25 homolog [Rhagoletis pomonella]XP_036345085.1 UPF0415 protein C7orf25 homolog [Rhagoletis pomonella]
MDKGIPFVELLERANEKVELGHELIEELEEYTQISGVQKIQRKISQEVKFLKKVIKNETLKLNHVQCSNLTHYAFLVQILKLQRDVVHVDCGFPVEGRSNPLRVDIVCDNGLRWIKAIARNSKSLSDAAKGAASYGARSILDQAQEFIDASAQHLCMFKPPKVVFYFSQTIDNTLLVELQEIGIEIASVAETSDCDQSADVLNVSTLNIDITTLLAYISNVCNGSCNWTFQEPILTEQAEKERQAPLKPLLDNLFEGKRLICCETAYKSFEEIIYLLAGPQEHQRAAELMKRVEVLPDVASVPDELAVIKFSGKINQRSLKIFAFGMQMKAVTVTSNKAFIRSAKMQGINVPVFTHQARALTEAKEASGRPIE